MLKFLSIFVLFVEDAAKMSKCPDVYAKAFRNPQTFQIWYVLGQKFHFTGNDMAVSWGLISLWKSVLLKKNDFDFVYDQNLENNFVLPW